MDVYKDVVFTFKKITSRNRDVLSCVANILGTLFCTTFGSFSRRLSPIAVQLKDVFQTFSCYSGSNRFQPGTFARVRSAFPPGCTRVEILNAPLEMRGGETSAHSTEIQTYEIEYIYRCIPTLTYRQIALLEIIYWTQFRTIQGEVFQWISIVCLTQ